MASSLRAYTSMSYAAFTSCGCLVAVIVDRPGSVERCGEIVEFKADADRHGLRVEYVTTERARGDLTACEHGGVCNGC